MGRNRCAPTNMRRRVKLVPTKRLYHSDPLLMEFTCEVLQCQPATGNSSPTPLYEVITDVTAFYPNSGGQPADRGTLDGADVVDVIERGDTIVHITPAEVPLGPTVGRIDIERRFDHMQQHSGQHILSSAFETLFGLETVGFHLGEEYHHHRPELTRGQPRPARSRRAPGVRGGLPEQAGGGEVLGPAVHRLVPAPQAHQQD